MELVKGSIVKQVKRNDNPLFASTTANSELTYKVTTRYHKEVTPDMFIKFKGRYFNIVSIINVKEKNEMLEIICTENLQKITFNANKREV